MSSKNIILALFFLGFTVSNQAFAEPFKGGVQALSQVVTSNTSRITVLEDYSRDAVTVTAHPLVVGRMVRDADVNPTFLAIAFEGQLDGLDIPFQAGVVKLNCSPSCPVSGLLLPRIRIINSDTTSRDLPVPTIGIPEIVGSTITGRVSRPGFEQLLFSNGVILEVVAPRSDPRILMYVEDTSLGSEISLLWDIYPND